MARVVHALVVLAVVGACWAQFNDSPVPSRLQVLGAVPVAGGLPRGRPAPITRVRRPQGRQQAYLPTPPARLEVTPPPPPPPTVQTTLPPRPVAEEVEEYDDLDDTTPVPQLPSSPPPNFPPPVLRQQLRSGPDRPIQIQVASPIPISISDIPVHSPTRQQFRQQQNLREQNARPAFRPEQRPQLLRPAPPAPLEEVPIRQQVRRPQLIPVEDAPQVAVPRQQFRQQARPLPTPVEQPQQRQQQEQFNIRPQQKQAYSPYKNQRERKPVAQVLNKYRNDNPDGSITWGYENDDGSFKEETIGVDCVVSGKYGYVDPDGQRREYTYSSGNPCDKTKDKEEVEDQGYIDYNNNAYVLPNGQSVPIQGSSKNRGRRPAPAAPANYGK